MITEHGLRSMGGKEISLNKSEKFTLERPPDGEKIEITVKKGVIRIAANQSNNVSLTLAFACRADTFRFNYPGDLEIILEAITDTTFSAESKIEREYNSSDAIVDWIIQFHIVRNEVNMENRLMKFFELVITRLGKRTSDGLLLEHKLSHARIAEIIGSTRSTVSRTISTLRKAKKIYIDELKGQIILPID